MRFLPGIIVAVTVLAAGPLLAFALHAQVAGAPQLHAGNPVMNGYSLDQFPDFIKKWHFVTVRYRKDTGEMRLTYANGKAWKALRAGGTSYPDGAVFAKIGIMTMDDPAFTSSVVPEGARRYQLMVRDAKKHKETDGWGYALFDAAGRTFEQDPEEQTAACHACHKLVPERDYVFSQPMRLEAGLPPSMPPEGPGVPPERAAFTTLPVKKLPPKLRASIPPPFKEARVMKGELGRHLFQGTIDEIRPTLAKEARRAHLPAVLVNGEGTRFSMVIAKQKAPACKLGNGKDGVEMLAIYTIKPGPRDVFPVQTLSWCEE